MRSNREREWGTWTSAWHEGPCRHSPPPPATQSMENDSAAHSFYWNMRCFVYLFIFQDNIINISTWASFKVCLCPHRFSANREHSAKDCDYGILLVFFFLVIHLIAGFGWCDLLVDPKKNKKGKCSINKIAIINRIQLTRRRFNDGMMSQELCWRKLF